jgi:hypothetical protein
MGSSDGGAPLRVLFFCHSLTYVRFFDSVVQSLLARGHYVEFVIERADHDRQEADWARRMGENVRFHLRVSNALRKDYWRPIAGPLRRAADYVRYLTPSFHGSPYLVARAERRAPEWTVRLLRYRATRARPVLAALMAAAKAVDAALPRNPALVDELSESRPDVVVLVPHLMPGNRQSDVVRAAQRLGIRTCIAVASWDNLSSKQLIHELPDVVIVWNETQRREAIEIHGIPADRVAVTGAQNFDHWFGWKARPRERFCERVGIDPDRPYLLYVCGSLFPGDVTEAQFVRRWIDALRASADSTLRGVGVIIRPHPKRLDHWDSALFDRLDGVVVWPPPAVAEMPISSDGRADFFDSIFHSAAVVGLNTSAMIEAAIIGRPVHAMVVDDFESSQRGVFHFDYLLTVGGGLLRTSHSIEENLAQVAEVLRSPPDVSERELRRGFLEEFVRPYGLERAATPLFVDVVERTGLLGPAPARDLPRSLLPLTALLVAIRSTMRAIERLQSLRLPPGAPLPEPPEPQPTTDGGRRILFSTLTPTTLKNFDGVIRELAERGHSIDILVHQPEQATAPPSLLRSLARMPRVRVLETPGGDSELRVRISLATRSVLDYLQFVDDRFHDSYRERAARRVPRALRTVLRPRVLRLPAIRRFVRVVLDGAERLQPPGAELVRYLRRLDPDVVLFTPYVALGAIQPDFLRAARSLKVPTAVCVASWDNLTSKSRLRPIPSRVLVWNETQSREATDLHGVPQDRVVVTGAQCFDDWLTWSPRSREEFCRIVGIDDARPFVLYTCFTPFKDGGTEVDFVHEWLSRLRSSEDAAVAGVSVIVRPHPKRTLEWTNVDLAAFGDAVVWPRQPRWPTDAESKADYFDSLYHSAAVVGINTSALLDAGIVGRPVLSILDSRFWDSQSGTLHFAYLIEGGLLSTARDLSEHERQLADILRGGDEARAVAARAFVGSFLRPHGIDRPATPLFVSAIEELATSSTRGRRRTPIRYPRLSRAGDRAASPRWR